MYIYDNVNYEFLVVTPVNHEPKPDPSRFLLRPSALDRQTANFHRDAGMCPCMFHIMCMHDGLIVILPLGCLHGV